MKKIKRFYSQIKVRVMMNNFYQWAVAWLRSKGMKAGKNWWRNCHRPIIKTKEKKTEKHLSRDLYIMMSKNTYWDNHLRELSIISAFQTHIVMASLSLFSLSKFNFLRLMSKMMTQLNFSTKNWRLTKENPHTLIRSTSLEQLNVLFRWDQVVNCV